MLALICRLQGSASGQTIRALGIPGVFTVRRVSIAPTLLFRSLAVKVGSPGLLLTFTALKQADILQAHACSSITFSLGRFSNSGCISVKMRRADSSGDVAMAALASDEAAEARENRKGPKIKPYRGNLRRHRFLQGCVTDVPCTVHLNLQSTWKIGGGFS